MNTVDKTCSNKGGISKFALIIKQYKKNQSVRLRPWLQPGSDVMARHNLCSPAEYSWCAAKPLATSAMEKDLFLQVLRKLLALCVSGTQLHVTANHSEQAAACRQSQPSLPSSGPCIEQKKFWWELWVNWEVTVVPVSVKLEPGQS